MIETHDATSYSTVVTHLTDARKFATWTGHSLEVKVGDWVDSIILGC